MASIVKKLKSNTFDVAVKLSVEELEQVINYAADKYYNTSKPVISDSLYDLLIDLLKEKNPKSSVLSNVGAQVKSKNKVKLDYWLGSMDKIKPPSNQLSVWTKKYPPPYNLSDKLDGVSALLTFNENSVKMFTRGTATDGTDITNLLQYIEIPDITKVINYCKKNKIKGEVNTVAFRGELIIKEDIFNKKFSDKLKNVRNSVAGLVNSKKVNMELAKATELVLYEVVDPFYPIEKQLDIINDIGFNCVTNRMYNKELTFEFLSSYLKERRSKSPYMIDGIIVTSCGKHERNVDGNPEYAFAFKDILEDQIALTKVQSVEWNVSKDGYIKPTVLVEPVTIGGVEIKRTTGFNAKFIQDNNIGPGAIIELIRSGDVIPYIQKVLKPSKSEFPKYKWHWNETKVDILLDDMNTNDVLVKNLHYFFSSLDTKGLGEKNIEKMVDAGLDSIKKILEADYQAFLMVEGFAEKSAKKLVDSVKKAVTNIPLARLMAASNKLGHGMGEERMKQVLSVYPNLLTEYKKWSKKEFIEMIKEINGWEEKTATQLVTNFNDFIKFYDSIKEYITLESKKELVKGKFTGKTVVLSGFRDKEIQTSIEEQGGKVSSSVSKSTDFLVIKDKSTLDDPTDKITKALDLGIKILTKDEIKKML
jgi:NAD-dependent DNA ligase